MPKITTPVTGPGPTTSNFPADRITHQHHSPKGESGPNPSGRPFDNGDSGVKTTPALEKGHSWGSDAHGGPQYDRGSVTGQVGDLGRDTGPKHVPDSSYSGAGEGRPASMQRGAKHG